MPLPAPVTRATFPLLGIDLVPLFLSFELWVD
jgi:hypothetical protein